MVKTRQISHLHLQLNENTLTNYVMIGTETTNITMQEKGYILIVKSMRCFRSQ